MGSHDLEEMLMILIITVKDKMTCPQPNKMILKIVHFAYGLA
jgi:hypothetical protein